MKDIININWEQYQKVIKWCPECWAKWLHWCPWKKTTWTSAEYYWINKNQFIENNSVCLWDSVSETFPWSWLKIWWLVCHCKKCSIIF